jgi:molybdopterin/thiamine biosynthesis adenylyltransferase
MRRLPFRQNADTVIYTGEGVLAQIEASLSAHGTSTENISIDSEIIEYFNSIVQASNYRPVYITPDELEETEQIEQLEEITMEENNENLIPVNSDTASIDESTSRFSGASWFDNVKKKTIIVAGCGGIGSWAVLLLARMKPASIFIYDDDTVEIGNMSGQLYRNSDIGKFKVDALAAMVSEYALYNSVFAVNEKFTEDTEASDIMICGFDNMRARKVFFNKWCSHVTLKSPDKRKNCLFIDARLAAEEFQILCIKGDDEYNILRYSSEFLFSDEEADATQCSSKQTSFCANMVASYMVNLFVNFCSNQVETAIERELPFFTSYNAELMFLKSEL